MSGGWPRVRATLILVFVVATVYLTGWPPYWVAVLLAFLCGWLVRARFVPEPGSNESGA